MKDKLILKDGSFHQKLGKGSLYLLLDEEKLTDGKLTLASLRKIRF